ncbi:MAG: hypothetical protein M1294_15485 [Firmicutes bacterium]|jgi:hypothetical protein|uniref:Uncharacterized protein n=1 Tax=Sulfobacillus benefaciens TaxID=453960 RepID=A0A2T2X2I7_9FIRM|nr:hypothetical protein [Bacillota bacterium]MCL5015200.1 hypothetical protein [Bacillota bacterium]PSR28705.1 MAG: hypothetical protein C7B43_09840 [Sulfobacillus benefaciens]HBQ95762.1 hypothetical protein [Sulfobacillus sp.]
MSKAEINVLDSEIRAQIDSEHLTEGALFGTVPQKVLSDDLIRSLENLGWVKRDYRDHPVMEPPQATLDWDSLSAQHRDEVLHAISHRLPQGTPWVGNQYAILEELIDSMWEQRQDEIRILLNAWAFAAAWTGHPDHNDRMVESRQTYYFYTASMRDAAEQAVALGISAPPADDDFWVYVESLNG